MPYTGDPQRFDHSAVVGDTYQPAEAQLLDSAGTAYSLSGASGECQVRSERGGALILEPTVTVTSAADGEFTWSSPASETADVPPGVYLYAVRLTFGDGTVRTVVHGRLTFTHSLIE